VKPPAVDEGHFAFGENWLSFVSTVDAQSVESSVESLARLLPAEEFAGNSGWPYQSATPEEIVSFMKQRGFTKFRSFTHAAVAGKT
jgi:hypothetical protein